MVEMNETSTPRLPSKVLNRFCHILCDRYGHTEARRRIKEAKFLCWADRYDGKLWISFLEKGGDSNR